VRVKYLKKACDYVLNVSRIDELPAVIARKSEREFPPLFGLYGPCVGICRLAMFVLIGVPAFLPPPTCADRVAYEILSPIFEGGQLGHKVPFIN